MGQDSNFRVFFKPLYIFDLPRRILQLVQASSLWDGNTRNSLPHSSGIARRTAESRAEQNPRWPGLSNEILSNWQDTTYSYLCFVAGIYIYMVYCHCSLSFCKIKPCCNSRFSILHQKKGCFCITVLPHQTKRVDQSDPNQSECQRSVCPTCNTTNLQV